MSKPFILGIGGFLHDGNIAVLDESGQIIHASQIERFNRKKHAPLESPDELESLLRLRVRSDILATIEHIAWVDAYLYSKPGKRAALHKWVQGLGRDVVAVDHHTAHLASTFYNSPFDNATLLSIDGKGDECSVKMALGVGNKIEEVGAVPMHYSLGRLWNATNTIVGVPGFQYAGKTMALASYGNPLYLDKLLTFVEFTQEGTFIFHTGDKSDSSANRAFFFEKQNIVDLLCKLTGITICAPGAQPSQAHLDLAASVQALTNILGLSLATEAVKRTGIKDICLAGGVALNGNMNKAIVDSGVVGKVFIQPAASDMGLGLGGAQYVYHHTQDNPRTSASFTPYLGYAIDETTVPREFLKAGLQWVYCSDVENETAKLLASGKIVAWVQGKEEFGPRALGNRSILVSPLVPGIKEDLNRKVKHREGYRPFAGSVIAERANEFFDIDVPSPHMLLIAQAREQYRAKLGAIVHVDGSIRLQTVTKEANMRYHELLQRFGALTGIPALLNTSLNDNEEPIVSSLDDAIKLFRRSQIDYLVVGNYIASR